MNENVRESCSAMEIRRSDSVVDYFDAYGFAVFDADKTEFHDDRCHEYQQGNQPVGADKDWAKVLKKWSRYTNGTGIKLSSLIKRGVPDAVRPKLWKKLLDIDLLKASIQFCYLEEVAKLREYLTTLNVTEYNTDRAEQELGHVETYEHRSSTLAVSNGQPSVQNLRQILLDVGRTFPTHLLFLGESPEAIQGRASLFRILAVYARFNPQVGYCQGMSFIAGMLAMVLSEEDSFWCLVALMQKPKYLCGYFDNTLSRVQMHAKIFDRLLEQRQSRLWYHLRSHNVDPLMYMTPWLMCLFTSLPCWDVVLSIWDLILLEGFPVVFRVALAIMEVLNDDFVSEKDGHRIILILQRPPATSVNGRRLLPVVWRTTVDLWELQTLQAVIDEETHKVSDGDRPSTASSDPPLGWQRVRKLKNDGKCREESSLLCKIAKIFNAKSKRPPNDVTESISTVPVARSTETLLRDPLLGVDGNTPGLQLTTSEDTTSESTSENVRRIRRLMSSGSKSRTQSVESLGKGVEFVAESGASQMQAFGAFSHPVSLRPNQRSRTSLLMCGSSGGACSGGDNRSPEMELQAMSARDSGLSSKKRRRKSTDADANVTAFGDDLKEQEQMPQRVTPRVPKFKKNKAPKKRRYLHQDENRRYVTDESAGEKLS